MNVHSPVFIPHLIVTTNSSMNPLLSPLNNRTFLINNNGILSQSTTTTTTMPSIICELDKLRQQQQLLSTPTPRLQHNFINNNNQIDYHQNKIIQSSVYYNQPMIMSSSGIIAIKQIEQQEKKYYHDHQQFKHNRVIEQKNLLKHNNVELVNEQKNIDNIKSFNPKYKIESKIDGGIVVVQLENTPPPSPPQQQQQNINNNEQEFWQLPLKEQLLHQLNLVPEEVEEEEVEEVIEKEQNDKEIMHQSLQDQFWQQLLQQCEYDVDTVQHNSSKAGHKIKYNQNNNQTTSSTTTTGTTTNKTSSKSGRTSNDNNNKRNNNKNKTHHHTHPWLISNLKGHTDEIRDIDFSSNGKYLASCSEDNTNNNTNNTSNITENHHHDNQQQQQHRGIIRHHNNGHRNSTTSTSSSSSTDSTAGSGSDDINCSSSNEDISVHMYHATKPISHKKSSKSGRNRQQQRQRQRQLKVINCNNIQTTTMEIDDELKENRNPHQQISTKITNNNKIITTQQQQSSSTTNLNGGGNGLTITTTTTTTRKQLSTSISPLKSVNLSKQQNHHLPSLKLSPSTSSISTDEIEEIVNMNRTISSTSSTSTSSASSPLTLNINELDLVKFLRYYVIDPNLLRIYGYPVESIYHDGSIEIFKCLSRPFTHYKTNGKFKKRCRNNIKNINNKTTNDGNIINESDGLIWSSRNLSQSSSDSSTSSSSMQISSSSSSGDSGQGDSGSSSPPSIIDSDTSDETGEEDFTTTFYTPDGNYQIFSNYNQFGEKQCVRCNRQFILSENGEYLTTEECNYHWGRPYQVYISGQGITNFVNCCNREQNSFGCCNNYVHVWSGNTVGINGPFNDYVQTTKNYLKLDDKQQQNQQYKQQIDKLRKKKVYAIDCEMCFTATGLDVGKVTIIDINGKLAYEKYIKPNMEIVDYNTRFSGITENDLSSINNPNVKTLKEVQNELLQFINSDTILIGHALDNDLRALKMLHKNVIDTSITFPHMSGFPYRRSLKHLTKNCLGRDIQTGEFGHCSFEDSQACLELILWRVQKDFELASE